MPAFDDSDAKRGEIARSLYLERSASDAAHRAAVNSSLGSGDLTASLIDALGLRPGHTLADVGCGAGLHLERFSATVGPTGRALGFDFAMDAVRAARARGLTAVVADAACIPASDRSFDALNAAYVVYYLGDPEAAMAEWARVVRPGGRIVVCGPGHDTNRELYSFHEKATQQPPSDADRIALGFVESRIQAAARALGLEDVEALRFENSVIWSDVESFLEYWQRSSLFLRTVRDRSAALARGRELLRGSGGLSISKVTDILVCRRRS